MRDVYDEAFYANQQDESYQSARAVLKALWASYRPLSVADVGCGVGTWLRAARELGVDDYLGIDGDHLTSRTLWIPDDRFVGHDLTRPLAVERRFDLAISVEVAEHLPPAAAETLVGTLTGLAPVVLFSAAVPNQGGDGHLNEQWPDYWASRFAEHGYLAFDCLRGRLWDDERIAWWYRQNLVVFTADAALLHGAGAPGVPRALVHPAADRGHSDPTGDAGFPPAGRPGDRWSARSVRQDESSEVTATVVVCTRDRAALVQQCLASLDTQLVEADELEVLVVDNGSTDETPDVLAAWQDEGPDRRVVCEPRAGLSHARNAALAASNRDVVIFVDDDAVTPPAWARAHVGAYRANPALGAAGGPVGLAWPAGRPEWMVGELEQWFSVLDLGDEAGPYPNVHGPYGTNMSVRRTAALDVGGFDPRFGRRGRRLLSSEERDLTCRLRAAGWAIEYVPRAAVVQQVLPERLTRRWLLRRGWAQGISNARFDVVHRAPSRRERLSGTLQEINTARQILGERRTDNHHELADLVLVLAHAGAAVEFTRAWFRRAGQ